MIVVCSKISVDTKAQYRKKKYKLDYQNLELQFEDNLKRIKRQVKTERKHWLSTRLRKQLNKKIVVDLNRYFTKEVRFQ